MTLSLNQRAHELADRVAAEADVLRVAVRTLGSGTRLVDCGSAVPGGLEAGRRLAEICMGGLGSVTYAPLVLDGRWLPGLTVATDHPALACLGSQYAGWKIDRDGYFAMASGPGRALIRAEELYDDLDVDERASAAVLCLETRDEPPEALTAYVAERAGVDPADVTLLFAPTASLAGGVQIAARIVETALHKLHELDFDVRRVVTGFGSCPLPPVAGDDMAAIGRTNDAVLYGGQVHLTVEADDDDALHALVERLPASASSDHGEPFGKVLKDANFDFYAIDPLLFSPAQIRLTSVSSGRSFAAGRVDLQVLERSFWA
jgi:methenyltetrahydromethanopterin cyclohydrolase